jgi:anthranilate 1,2-dioxygenase large subunit
MPRFGRLWTTTACRTAFITIPRRISASRSGSFAARPGTFSGLEAEIPNPGDFRTTYVGDTPVIVNRDANGTIHALVNRCAHRGAMVRREMSGNATSTPASIINGATASTAA